MAIDEQEDLRWWKNTHGPGMPTDWPHFQVSQTFVLLKLRSQLSSSCFTFIFFKGMDACEEKQKREERGREDRNDREEVGKFISAETWCYDEHRPSASSSVPSSSSVMIGGVRVRALYDYVGQETDELSFKAGKHTKPAAPHEASRRGGCALYASWAPGSCRFTAQLLIDSFWTSSLAENWLCLPAGEEFLKIEDEDDQGWCRGIKDDGWEGLYPANYVEVV